MYIKISYYTLYVNRELELKEDILPMEKLKKVLLLQGNCDTIHFVEKEIFQSLLTWDM